MKKALSFIDYYNSVVTDMCSTLKSPYKPTFENLQDVLRKTHVYYELLSQPFLPEMLLSVFEGWETSAFNSKNILSAKGCVFRKDSDENGYFLGFLKRDSGSLWIDIVRGITLNDFISDCTRSGIELQFKEEITKTFV